MLDTDALNWLFAQRRTGPRGPERVRAILERLGHPEGLFDVIHVVGTNGKGSVCAMLDAGLQAAGLRVGRFTSPHLLRFAERITVDGHEILALEIEEFIIWAQQHATDGAFFDLAIALACQHFARNHVGVAVIEAGVGGATDPTMAFERVRLLVLTNVDLDHQETLGPGIRDIALDKAGAIRAGIPVVTAARGEALEVIKERALERGAMLHVLNDANPLFALPSRPRLRGHHQLENARLALASLRLLGCAEASLNAALNATWPARLEEFRLGGRVVVIDGAHNPAGSRALADELQAGYTLIFGAFERKKAHETLLPLLPGAHRLIFVAPPGPQLAADVHALAQKHDGQAFDSFEDALKATLEITPMGGCIVVTGSLYLAGLARQTVLEMGGKGV
jgi:dihydrofolate synthase/folylpolyglutamate synthase